MGFFSKELFFTIIIMGGSMSFGYTMAYYSPAAAGIIKDLGLSETWATIFNASACVLAIVSGVCTQFLIRLTGRRMTLFITGVVATAFWIIQGTPNKKCWWLAIISRCFLGLTVGSFSTVCPMYITELAPLAYRQTYGVLHQFGVVIGACLCYLLGIWCRWNLLSFLGSIPVGIMCFLVWFIPESPRQAAEKNDENQGPTKESICQSKFIKPLLISLGLMFFQQFSGCNGLLSNLESMFEEAGSTLSPAVASFLVGLSGMIATGVASPLVGWMGHRPAWFVSSFCCFAALFIAGLNNMYHWSHVLPVICLILDNFCFGLGMGPIPWVVLQELFPDGARPAASSLMTGLNWGFAAAVMALWPVMAKGIGLTWSWMTFSFICFGGFLFGFAIPSTKGKEMGQIYDNDKEGQLKKSLTEA